MPNYFYKDNKYKTWESSCEEAQFSNIVNIQTTQYPLLMFSLD